MEEDGDRGEDITPFWLQNNTNLRRADKLRRGASSVFFSSELVVFLLLVTAVLFLVFVVPSTLSLSSQIFKPNSVKKSWDSLNVLLVLVAVVLGFLSRNTNEDRYSTSYYGDNQESISGKQNGTQKSNPSTQNHWYNLNTIEGERSNLSSSDRWYENTDFQTKMEQKNPILRRNSSSYPDLREFSSTRWAHGNLQRRFDDDMDVGASRVSDDGQLHRRHRSMEEVDYLRIPSQTKTVFVDTLVSKSMQAEGFPHSPPLPPYRPIQPSLPPAELQEKSNSTEGTVVRKKERSRRKVEKDMESLHTVSTEKTPPPPPPPPPPLAQQNRSKSDRKRGGSGGSSSATKDFLNSLYQKKKKKQRQKSVDNLDFLLHKTEAPLSFQLPPSSPPSPPPPSVFQNLFSSKKHKRKRTITVTVKSPSPAPPPPPPPPPTPPEPPRPRNAEPEQIPSSRNASSASQKPDSFEKLAEISNSGGESPLNRVPPPPPPPPFLKKPAWKFVVQGDYVRLDSIDSSRSESPDLDELDSDTASDVGIAAAPPQPSPLFCPSPDVNTKAESFITNFRAKLKLERHHSMKTARELGLSSLGPGPGPSQI